MPRRTLTRDTRTYEFIVRYPHGTSAINGYRRAARHFGLHTREDSTTIGSDATRLFVHRDAARLRAADRTLSAAYASNDDSRIEDAEWWLAADSGVHWFEQDWNGWEPELDEGALEHLGWRREMTERDGRSESTRLNSSH